MKQTKQKGEEIQAQQLWPYCACGGRSNFPFWAPKSTLKNWMWGPFFDVAMQETGFNDKSTQISEWCWGAGWSSWSDETETNTFSSVEWCCLKNTCTSHMAVILRKMPFSSPFSAHGVLCVHHPVVLLVAREQSCLGFHTGKHYTSPSSSFFLWFSTRQWKRDAEDINFNISSNRITTGNVAEYQHHCSSPFDLFSASVCLFHFCLQAFWWE